MRISQRSCSVALRVRRSGNPAEAWTSARTKEDPRPRFHCLVDTKRLTCAPARAHTYQHTTLRVFLPPHRLMIGMEFAGDVEEVIGVGGGMLPGVAAGTEGPPQGSCQVLPGLTRSCRVLPAAVVCSHPEPTVLAWQSGSNADPWHRTPLCPRRVTMCRQCQPVDMGPPPSVLSTGSSPHHGSESPPRC